MFHNNVTCPLQDDLEYVQTLMPGPENVKGHLSPGSDPAVSQVMALLSSGVRVRQTEVTSVFNRYTIKLSCYHERDEGTQ